MAAVTLPQSDPHNMLDAALDYAGKGWRLFPLNARSKDPMGDLAPKGCHSATTKEGTIRSWFYSRPNPRHNPNLGIATGAESGVIVLDIDKDGMPWLEEHRDQLPLTRTARSGSGGWHFYLGHPGGYVANSAKKIAPGVDIRGDGGYIVAPPSIHPNGNRYEWVDECEPAPSPDWLLSLLRAPERSASAPVTGQTTDYTPEDGAGARLLRWALRKLKEGGTRNHWGAKLAQQLHWNRFQRDEAERIMLEYHRTVQWEGPHEYEESEALKSLASAWKQEMRPPAEWPTSLEAADEAVPDAEPGDQGDDTTLYVDEDAANAPRKVATQRLTVVSSAHTEGEPKPDERGEADAEPQADNWPKPPAPEAFYGLAGHIVSAIYPHSEADPVALLVTFLVWFGCIVGRGPHYVLGKKLQHAKLYGAIVGQSARARKGDSAAPVKSLFKRAEELLASRFILTGQAAECPAALRVSSGLASGEGLIYAVRNRMEGPEVGKDGKPTGQTVVTDPGVTDKRLLIFESELVNILLVGKREGNTVSVAVRQAWDDDPMETLAKGKDARAIATESHIAIMGHITFKELRKRLSDVDIANGFANRILWACVRRSHLLPIPEPFEGEKFDSLAGDLLAAIEAARRVGRMRHDEAARALWEHEYVHTLSVDPAEDDPAGELLARAEPITLRLSMIYALLDGSEVIREEHLRAALALWDFSRRSVYHIWGDGRTGDPVADKILRGLREHREMTRTDISRLFKGHAKSGDISRALDTLRARGVARWEPRPTGGRDAGVWTLA